MEPSFVIFSSFKIISSLSSAALGCAVSVLFTSYFLNLQGSKDVNHSSICQFDIHIKALAKSS